MITFFALYYGAGLLLVLVLCVAPFRESLLGKLTSWWKRNRPDWLTARRRWAKRKHLRHVIATVFRFNVLVAFAWLGGFALTVFC